MEDHLFPSPLLLITICGAIDAEEDTWEEEWKVYLALQEETEKKNMERSRILYEERLQEEFQRKTKPKGPKKKKQAAISQAKREEDSDCFDGETFSLLFEEKEAKADLKDQDVAVKESSDYVGSKAPKEDLSKVGKGRDVLASPVQSLSLHPLGFRDGGIDYKVKSKGGSKPFAKARVVLPPDKSPSDEERVKEMLFTIYSVEIPRETASRSHLFIKPSHAQN